MVFISIIIPIYNVEEYLEECLNSVINQTFKDIEIICINDGSTDSSLAILEKYHRLDNRIKIINQENKGVGVARNVGIDFCEGKYLFFIDSDDYIELNALEELVSYAEEKDVDFLLYPAINYDSDNEKFFKTDIYSMKNVDEFIGDEIVDYKDLDNLIFSIPVTAYSKLYNADFVKKNNIKFTEGLIFEDNLFFWDLLFNAKRIAFYPKHFYIHRRYSNSITTLYDERFTDSIEVNRLMVEKFREFGLLEKFKNILYNRRINLTYLRFVEIIPKYKEAYFKKLKKDYEKIVSDGYFDDYLSNLDDRNKSILQSCLNSNTCKEFQFEMAFWDSRNTNKNLQNEINQLKNDFDDFQNEINNLNEKNKNLKKDIVLLKEKNFSINEDMILLNNENSELKKENSVLSDDLVELKKENSTLNEEILLLNNQNSILKSDLNRSNNKNEIFKEDIKVLTDENLDFKNQVCHLENENSKLKEYIEILDNEKKVLTEQKDDLISFNDDLKSQNLKLQEEIQYQKIINIRLKNRLKFLNERT